MRSTDSKDNNRRYYRSGERVFQMNGDWYFEAREGDVGPFTTAEVARREMSRFISEKQDLVHFQACRDANVKVVKTKYQIVSGPVGTDKPPEAESPSKDVLI